MWQPIVIVTNTSTFPEALAKGKKNKWILFWQWCMAIMIAEFLNFIHHSVFFKVLNVLGTESIPILRYGAGGIYCVGPLERASLQWLRLALNRHYTRLWIPLKRIKNCGYCKLLTKFNLVWLQGNRGLWNFRCEPTAPAKGWAEKLAHTKLMVSIHDWSSFESLWRKYSSCLETLH